ncbi:hypothetical protein LZ198_34095 [Myxococcus sp. K15C18031901]|uniref:hypothetical protein n=1 Tax=Myxococcus dinghuensis TaxID=2906761 RepID=UPI0020A745B3|nr:hypothetical protein [Myxococcus dinghuensis]MCP3103920.1 hypothetical protein [Myxococcus dinghuensis]
MSQNASPAGPWWRWPRSLVLALALGTLVSLPSLRVGLLLDDLVHRLVLSGRMASMGDWGPLTLYEFVGAPRAEPVRLREAGLLPWWASDSLTVRFFRPVPSALLSVDTWLFGEAPFPAHLHSLAWYLALVALVGWLHRRLLPGAIAALATAVYAIASAHMFPVAWLASRHPLVSGVLGLLAFAAYLREREDGWRPGRILSPLALLAALLSGEVALGTAAMLGVYEGLGRREGWRVACSRLAPHGLLVLGYLTWYLGQGYGAHGSGGYLDPLAAPGTVLVTVLQRVLILMGELLVATPSDVAAGLPALHAGFAAWGALCALGALLLLRSLWGRLGVTERRTLSWLLPGGLVATLPGAVGIVGGRVLMLPLVAGSALAAVLMARGWEAFRDDSATRGARRRAFLGVAVLALGHLALAPLFRVGLGVALARIAEAQWRIAREAPHCDGTLVMVAASDPTVALYVPAAMVLLGREPRGFRLLSAAPHDHVLERTSDSSFDLVVRAAPRQPGFWEQVNRASAPPAGTRLALGDLRVTVAEADEGGFTRAHFDFGRPLESKDLCFVTWRGEGLQAVSLPPPGGHLELPFQRGPAGL